MTSTEAMGLSSPRAVWRRRGLYQASIHSKIAAPGSSGLFQVRW